jgi:hypothetical protein
MLPRAETLRTLRSLVTSRLCGQISASAPTFVGASSSARAMMAILAAADDGRHPCSLPYRNLSIERRLLAAFG